MENKIILPNTIKEILKHEGVVSIVSWTKREPHITNTWNSHITLVEDDTFLIPAGVMRRLEQNIKKNNAVKVSLGSREVLGFNNYQGTGFILEGVASFLYDGDYFNSMVKEHPWITRVLVIKITSYKQLL